LANLGCLLPGAFPAPGLFGQRFRQPLDLFSYLRLCSPQFPGSRPEPGP